MFQTKQLFKKKIVGLLYIFYIYIVKLTTQSFFKMIKSPGLKFHNLAQISLLLKIISLKLIKHPLISILKILELI
jgi:hypothetical protein